MMLQVNSPRDSEGHLAEVEEGLQVWKGDDIDEDDEGVMVISPTIFLAMVIGMVIGKQWMVKMILQSKAQG